MNYNSFIKRIIGSARLDSACYEAVEADHHANFQAIAVVLISSIAGAIGFGVNSIGGIVGLLVAVLATWIVWVLLTLLIGTTVLPEPDTRADFGQVLRTTGFSASPGILRILGVVPGIGVYLFLTANVWMLFSFVIAIRQALDYTSTSRAFAVSVLGWAINFILLFGFEMKAI